MIRPRGIKEAPALNEARGFGPGLAGTTRQAWIMVDGGSWKKVSWVTPYEGLGPLRWTRKPGPGVAGTSTHLDEQKAVRSVVIAYLASCLSAAGVPRSPLLVQELVRFLGQLLAAV